MKKILQIDFKFKATRPQVEQVFLQGAQPIANVKGLLWKVWLMNEAEKSAGGIYLFKDDASVEAYLKGEIIAATKNNPAVSDIEVKVFDILPEPTKITRGPVD
ncbi:MAG: YdhR family protein [Candidatus Bathyarchaeia archaeon]